MYYYYIDDEEITRVTTSGDFLQAFGWSQKCDCRCDVPCCLEKKRVEISYVGLVHTALPTNTNFQLTFLLIRLLEALFEDLPV